MVKIGHFKSVKIVPHIFERVHYPKLAYLRIFGPRSFTLCHRIQGWGTYIYFRPFGVKMNSIALPVQETVQQIEKEM